jgi:hypothetical protein
MKNMVRVGLTALVVLSLTGCVGGIEPPDPSRSNVPVPQPTPSEVIVLPTAAPQATPRPTPTPTPPDVGEEVADYEVNGFHAQQLWDLCHTAVTAQYGSYNADFPGITDFQSLTEDGVRDANFDGKGHVAVFAPSVPAADGKPLAIWICEFSGDPGSPHLEYASLADR